MVAVPGVDNKAILGPGAETVAKGGEEGEASLEAYVFWRGSGSEEVLGGCYKTLKPYNRV